MKRKDRRPAPPSVPSSARSRAKSVRLGRLGIAVVGIFAIALIAGATWWWQSRQVTLPSIDLAKVEPGVAANLRQHMDAVRRQPRSGPAWGWLGGLLWAYDFRTEASFCLTKAEILEPGNARWPYYHGLILMVARPSDAIPLLRNAVRQCGNSPEAPRFRLAHLLAEQGRWDEARSEFEPLLAERPAFAPARLLAARAAQSRGDLDKAIELVRGCTDDPRTARSAQLLLMALCRQKGDTNGADQALRQSAKLQEDARFEDPFAAEVTLLRGDPRALSDQAHPLLAAGQLTQAAPLVERLRSANSDYPETWLLVGRLRFLQKDLPGAEQALRRHIEMNPHSAQGLFQLGSVLLASGQLTNAAAAFEKATQLKPDFGPAHYNRGLALGRAGQVERAMAAFRESLRHNPERLETYLFLADLHLRRGERDSANALLSRAESINPNDSRVKALRQRVLP